MKTLTRLTINKFRNVAPTTLEFRPGINVLLGRNAAGKTTLLRLMSSLLGRTDAAPRDELLDVSFHVKGDLFELDQTTLQVHADTPALPIEMSRRGASPFPSTYQVDSLIFTQGSEPVLKAELSPNEVVIERKGAQRRITRPMKGAPIQSLVASLWSTPQDADLRNLTAGFLSAQVDTAGRMDESLESFHSLLRLEVQEEGAVRSWSLFGGVPRSMFELAPPPIPEGTTATFQVAFLDRVAQVLGYESATARFDVERVTPEPNRHVLYLSKLKFYFTRAGEQVSHEWLSYGQKRLLAFFAHADASPDIVIADELVNGLHHEWISACLDELHGRQAFLTSQNPLLLDFLRFDSTEDVRRTFILCERAQTESGEQLIWRNLTEDEAESFFLAYQTGIQRVSDILLTKGLW
ncbi:AAA family ATPase [Corallococcus caeni]|uniref:ATPase AAA-type core domain-containing protein n=1 Tax=Corallococcus caeni TaxID=3082388 RepID=A0ABQ6R3Q2_9BACT|nr:hypothetical protein ASNO1_72080 [Corallococcus sp. NO1]